MKIGIIADNIDDGAAGVGVYTKEIVNNLLKIDSKNEYIIVHYRKNKDKFFEGKKELIVPMKNIPFYREFRKIFILPRIFAKKKFDIIHEPMQMGPFFFKKKFKAVVTVHDLIPLIYPETFNRSVYLHHKYGMKRILKNVDKIITVSNNTKEDIIKKFNVDESKIKVIYNGASDWFHCANEKEKRDFRKKLSLDFPYILYLGTIEPRKNLIRLIKAFHQLKFEKPNSKVPKIKQKLVIGGAKGWKYSNIFKLIKDLKIEKEVIFLGFVDDKDMSALYSCADVFVFPSIYEGFGIPIVEAMACGCPVISSNKSSIPEVVGDAGLMINPEKTKELASAIDKILKDEKLRKKLISRGLERQKKFRWENAAKEVLKTYEEVAKP